jgi:hypothetical protein
MVFLSPSRDTQGDYLSWETTASFQILFQFSINELTYRPTQYGLLMESVLSNPHMNKKRIRADISFRGLI